MFFVPALFTALCLVLTLCLLVAEGSSRQTSRVVFKLTASTCFVGLALSFGDVKSIHGQFLVLAFICCWVGDACLLSRRSIYFIAGLLAFLLGHVAFALAFALAPASAPLSLSVLLPLILVGIVVLRWLWPYLSAFFRVAVSAYVFAILLMCAMATALSVGTGIWLATMGAVVFAISDLAVARDQFVSPAFVNKLWGLPLYYVSQLLIAWSQFV